MCGRPTSTRSIASGEQTQLPVVVAQRCDVDAVRPRDIDHPVLPGDASGPGASEGELQWLGFADTRVRIAHRILDESVDPLEDRAVLALPPQVVLPCVVGEGQSSHASSRGVPRPSARLSSDSARRLAFAERTDSIDCHPLGRIVAGLWIAIAAQSPFVGQFGAPRATTCSVS